MFNSFKKVIIASVALLTISTFSLSVLHAQNSTNELVGTWKLESTEWDTDVSQLEGRTKEMYEIEKGFMEEKVLKDLIIVFKEDGTFTRKVTQDGKQVVFTSPAKIEGNKITTSPDAEGNIIILTFAMNDEVLTLVQNVKMIDGTVAKLNLYLNNE